MAHRTTVSEELRSYQSLFGSPLPGYSTDEPYARFWATNIETGTFASGHQYTNVFTACVTETIRGITVWNGLATTAGQTSLCRIGVSQVDDQDNLTLVADSGNVPTLAEAVGARTATLLTPWQKVAGMRYAVSIVWVGTSTFGPQLAAHGTSTFMVNGGIVTNPNGERPVTRAKRTGCTDLTLTLASTTDVQFRSLYFALKL